MPPRKKKREPKAQPPTRTLDELVAEGERLREHGDRIRESMRQVAAAIEAARVDAELARARSNHSRKG